MLLSVIAELWESLLVKTLASIVAPLLAAATYYLFRKLYRAFQALRFARAALAAVSRREDKGVCTEGAGFWLRQTSDAGRPANYGDLRGTSIPILMIAATKGGVGKTSLAGSLAAHFAICWTQRRQNPNTDMPLRVLVIDQDFQASFSLLTVGLNVGPGPGLTAQLCKSNRLVSGELGNGRVAEVAEPVSRPGMIAPLAIWTIPSDYDLAQAENRMLVNWLLPIRDEGFLDWLLQVLRIRKGAGVMPTDVRYILADALLDSRVQSKFDLIIIDSPPRLTTSHIQGMCAATHLLVPTILDGLAADAVYRYLDQVAIHKFGPAGNGEGAICPHVQPIGVVCTLLPPGNFNPQGPLTLLTARIAAGRLRPDIAPTDCFIRQRAPYREHAGERIAYAAVPKNQAHQELRSEVDRLGDWLAPKIGAAARGWTRRP